MKKIKLTDKKLALVRRIIDDFCPFILFIMGIGVGYLLTPGLDVEKAYSLISDAFGGSFMFFGFLMFCYIAVTVERIFLFLRGKENEKSDT